MAKAPMLAVVGVLAVLRISARRVTVDTSSGSLLKPLAGVLAPALCDADIVQETCREFPGASDSTNGVVTSAQIQERLSANSESIATFWETLGLAPSDSGDGAYTALCAELCDAIVNYVEEVGVLPKSSDMACINFGTTTRCDQYVGPDVLSQLGPKEDQNLPDFHDKEVRADLADVEDIDEVEGDSTDIEEDTTDWEGDSLLEAQDNQTRMRSLRTVLAQKTKDGIQYGIWEMVERVAHLFRIFPAPKPTSDSSLMEAENEGLCVGSRCPGRWPAGMHELTVIKEAQTKAYLNHAIRAFGRQATETQMTRWFGKKAYKSKKARKIVLDIMNSVTHMITNVHYVPNGKDCKSNTYAYVYPMAYTDCTKRQTLTDPCTMTKDGKYVFYLCNVYFELEDEMIETLVHEGSHHATAYTDDVQYKGASAYGRGVCKALAKSSISQALKNADNFCYYIQDVAANVPAVSGRPEVTVPVIPEVIRPVETPVDEEDDNEGDAAPQVKYDCKKGRKNAHLVKSKRPNNQGDCQCGPGFTCYKGSTKKCPFNGAMWPSHKFFGIGCKTCTCEYK